MTPDADLADLVARFVNRRSIPMHLDGDGKATARDDEIAALTICAADLAPSVATAAWWAEIERHIARHVTGRSWPTERNLVDAAAAIGKPKAVERDERQTFGDRVTDVLASWFATHKSQCPGLGSERHTLALIERGVLRSLREARFRGFAMSESMIALALLEPMDPDEWDHHVGVMARLRSQSVSQAEAVCRAELLTSTPPRPDARPRRIPTHADDGF